MHFGQPINFARLAARCHKITECVKLHVWFNILCKNLTIQFFGHYWVDFIVTYCKFTEVTINYMSKIAMSADRTGSVTARQSRRPL